MSSHGPLATLRNLFRSNPKRNTQSNRQNRLRYGSPSRQLIRFAPKRPPPT